MQRREIFHSMQNIENAGGPNYFSTLPSFQLGAVESYVPQPVYSPRILATDSTRRPDAQGAMSLKSLSTVSRSALGARGGPFLEPSASRGGSTLVSPRVVSPRRALNSPRIPVEPVDKGEKVLIYDPRSTGGAPMSPPRPQNLVEVSWEPTQNPNISQGQYGAHRHGSSTLHAGHGSSVFNAGHGSFSQARQQFGGDSLYSSAASVGSSKSAASRTGPGSRVSAAAATVSSRLYQRSVSRVQERHEKPERLERLERLEKQQQQQQQQQPIGRVSRLGAVVRPSGMVGSQLGKPTVGSGSRVATQHNQGIGSLSAAVSPRGVFEVQPSSPVNIPRSLSAGHAKSERPRSKYSLAQPDKYSLAQQDKSILGPSVSASASGSAGSGSFSGQTSDSLSRSRYLQNSIRPEDRPSLSPVPEKMVSRQDAARVPLTSVVPSSGVSNSTRLRAHFGWESQAGRASESHLYPSANANSHSSQVEQLKAEIERLSASNEVAMSRLSDEQKVTDRYKLKVDALEAELTRAGEELTRAGEEILSEQAKSDELKLRAEKAIIRAESAEARHSTQDGSVTSGMHESVRKVEDLTLQVETLKKTVESKTRELHAVSRETSDLRRESGELRRANTELNKDLAELRKKVALTEKSNARLSSLPAEQLETRLLAMKHFFASVIAPAVIGSGLDGPEADIQSDTLRTSNRPQSEGGISVRERAAEFASAKSVGVGLRFAKSRLSEPNPLSVQSSSTAEGASSKAEETSSRAGDTAATEGQVALGQPSRTPAGPSSSGRHSYSGAAPVSLGSVLASARSSLSSTARSKSRAVDSSRSSSAEGSVMDHFEKPASLSSSDALPVHSFLVDEAVAYQVFDSLLAKSEESKDETGDPYITRDAAIALASRYLAKFEKSVRLPKVICSKLITAANSDLTKAGAEEIRANNDDSLSALSCSPGSESLGSLSPSSSALSSQLLPRRAAVAFIRHVLALQKADCQSVSSKAGTEPARTPSVSTKVWATVAGE